MHISRVYGAFLICGHQHSALDFQGYIMRILAIIIISSSSSSSSNKSLDPYSISNTDR